MAHAAYQQDDFLGGQWDGLNQGRSKLPTYHSALNTCLNFIPVEQGALVRRSGTEWMGPTYLRGIAKMLGFQSNASNPFGLELTNDKLRLWYGTGPVCTNDRQVITASSSAAGVISLTTTTNHGWAVGDHIVLYCPTSITAANRAVVANRHLCVTAQNGTTGLTLKDDLSVALPSDISANGLNGATAIRVLRFDGTGITTAMLPNARIVQAQTQAIILSAVAPKTLKITTDLASGSDTDPTVSFAATSFSDGPYLDPIADAGTVSGYTGSITYATAAQTFVSTDVGRHIRLFSQPAAWASGTTYTNGQYVTDSGGAWWVFVYSSGLAGVIPGTTTTISGVPVAPWAPAPTIGQWAWGTITAFTNSTHVTISLTTNLNSANGTTMTQSQMGLYTTGQYPTCGTFYKGRIWLAGALPNRFDASMPFDPHLDTTITFSPTDVFGNVNDDDAVADVINSDDVSAIYWMKPDHEGLVVGTNGPEYLLHTSNLNDPVTPTSLEQDVISRLGSANIEPVRPGIVLAFVQRYTRRVIEFFTENFSGAKVGRHLNEYAKAIAAPGIKEVSYQEETVPVIWSVFTDGTWAGCTYRRVSRFATEPPAAQGWHRHAIGYDGTVTVNSHIVLPGVAGIADNDTDDRLYVNTVDLNGYYWVETLRPLFEDA